MKSIRPATGFLVSFLVVLAMCPPAVRARTWRVEKDGSGDYTIIQDAVDAAASGDTISIGPGRFNDRRYYSYPGWSDSVIVTVFQYELTIIGSGPETVLGQEDPWTLEQGSPKAINAGDLAGNHILHVSNLRIENMRDGIYTSYEFANKNRATISDCEFYQNNASINAVGEGGSAEIVRCIFTDQARDGFFIAAWSHNDLRIADCTFQLPLYSTWPQHSIGLVAVQKPTISNCVFYNGTRATTISYCDYGVITRCSYHNQNNAAFVASILANVAIDNCVFEGQNTVTSSYTSDNSITMLSSVTKDILQESFSITSAGPMSVNNCDIAHGGRGSVNVISGFELCSNPVHLDFSDNYWGSSSTDSIEAWIHDFNDSDKSCYAIDYQPFRGVSTPTQKKSMGSLKAMFR